MGNIFSINKRNHDTQGDYPNIPDGSSRSMEDTVEKISLLDKVIPFLIDQPFIAKSGLGSLLKKIRNKIGNPVTGIEKWTCIVIFPIVIVLSGFFALIPIALAIFLKVKLLSSN